MKKVFCILLSVLLLLGFASFSMAEDADLTVHVITNGETVDHTFTRTQLNDLMGDAIVFSYANKSGTAYGKAQGVELTTLFDAMGVSMAAGDSIAFTDKDTDYTKSFTYEALFTIRYAFDGETNMGEIAPMLAISEMTGATSYTAAADLTLTSDNAYRNIYGQTAAGEVTLNAMVKGIDEITITRTVVEQPDLTVHVITNGETVDHTFTRTQLNDLMGDAIVFSYANKSGTAYGKAQGVELTTLFDAMGVSMAAGDSIAFTDKDTDYTKSFTYEALFTIRYAFDGETNMGEIAPMLAISEMTGATSYTAAADLTLTSDNAYRNIYGQTAAGEVTLNAMVKGIDEITITRTLAATLYGDANCDGKVTPADAAAILRDTVKIEALSELGAINGDVDGLAGTTSSDAACILRWTVLIITVFPVEVTH